MIRLTKRLQTIVGFVPSGVPVADVGTDHALIPCYLAIKGISPWIIGIEIRQGPYNTARRNIKSHHLSDRIDLRLGNGLLPLQKGEVGVIIIAGLGGSTMVKILEEGDQIADRASTLILQPMNGAKLVREWLVKKNRPIVKEELVAEDNIIYEIIVAGTGNHERLTCRELIYGPHLIRSKHPLLPLLLERDKLSLQEILSQLGKSERNEALERAGEVKAQIQLIKELEECLSVVKE